MAARLVKYLLRHIVDNERLEVVWSFGALTMTDFEVRSEAFLFPR